MNKEAHELSQKLIAEIKESAEWKHRYATSQQQLSDVVSRHQHLIDEPSQVSVIVEALNEGYSPLEAIHDITHFVITGEGTRPESRLTAFMAEVEKARELALRMEANEKAEKKGKKS